ncbi:MAG: hypothetical protein C0517_11750 [Erythrobacter sp.]|nr:hypothetical protein [Erythrobacter sp.]
MQAVLADTAAEITVIDYDVDGCDFRSEETFLIQSSNIHPPDPAWRFVFDAEIDPARIDHIKTARRHPDYDAAITDLKETDLEYSLTIDDLDKMRLIARVSSQAPGTARWTELALYVDPHFAAKTRKRPFIAVAEGHSIIPGERLKRQFVASGSLTKALAWFDDSELANDLQRAVGIEIGDIAASGAVVLARLSADEAVTAPIDQPRPALTSLTAALAWLYPGEGLSDRARALAFERDFGLNERTVRNIMAIEGGRVDGKVGPWVAPMLAALRWFDRQAWDQRDA